MMLKAYNISHQYGKERVLQEISLEIEQGSFTVLGGESGSGKSTLLAILSTLLEPTRGSIVYGRTPRDEIENIDRFRREQIGFVFQFHYLIDHLTLFENVALATDKGADEIDALLERLEILHLKARYPDEISGGQRQRAAIARALINDPVYLFADEPTGNLDSRNSRIVFEILRHSGATVIVATHDRSLIRRSDRLLTLKDGKLC